MCLPHALEQENNSDWLLLLRGRGPRSHVGAVLTLEGMDTSSGLFLPRLHEASEAGFEKDRGSPALSQGLGGCKGRFWEPQPLDNSQQHQSTER